MRVIPKHVGVILLSLLTNAVWSVEPRLPQTEPLLVEQPLDEVMIAGLRRYCLRELAASRQQRLTKWSNDSSDAAADLQSIVAHRERLQAMIRAVDSRVTADALKPRRFELITALDRSSILARSGQDTMSSHEPSAIRWSGNIMAEFTDGLVALLAHMLRHHPERYLLEFDAHVWADLDAVVMALRCRRREWSRLSRHQLEQLLTKVGNSILRLKKSPSLRKRSHLDRHGWQTICFHLEKLFPDIPLGETSSIISATR